MIDNEIPFALDSDSLSMNSTSNDTQLKITRNLIKFKLTKSKYGIKNGEIRYPEDSRNEYREIQLV